MAHQKERSGQQKWKCTKEMNSDDTESEIRAYVQVNL